MEKVLQALKGTGREISLNDKDAIVMLDEQTGQQIRDLEMQRGRFRQTIRLMHYYMCMTDYIRMIL